MAAGRAAAVAACASPAVPRRSLLLSTAAAALQPEPVRLTRGASAAPKLRASPPDAAQAAAAFGSKEEAFAWAKSDNRRLLHVVYRVGDIDRTIKFYTECLGMKLLRKRDIPEEKYTNAFLGYGAEDNHFVVELTYNYGVDKYDIGAGFGHFGIAVDDVAKTVELIDRKSTRLNSSHHFISYAVFCLKKI